MSSASRTGTAPSSQEPTPGAPERPLRVGLTGNIGSGKSSVARLLEQRGAVVIDADALARQATLDPEVLERIEADLGPGLVEAGALDRARLAARVFSDAGARERLNAIVHPWVAQRRAELEAQAAAAVPAPPMIVHDVPLLYEVGLDAEMDTVIVVYAPLEARLERLALRSGLERGEALARDRAQLPLEEKAARAEHVLDNSGSLPDLEDQVARLWDELTGAPPESAHQLTDATP